MIPIARDPTHWLYRLSAREWIQAALRELKHSEEAYRNGDLRAGLAGARRAAGMALNAALWVEPNKAWGRSYMDHVQALAKHTTIPDAVRNAAHLLLNAPAPGGNTLIRLRTKESDKPILDAAHTIMAHAYTVYIHFSEEEL